MAETDNTDLTGTPNKTQGRAPRERLDVLLTRRGLAPTRERARAFIMAGVVLVDGREALKPGALTRADAAIEIVAQPAETRYVSRGGLKLERALEAFQLDPVGPRLPRHWRFDRWIHRCPAAGRRAQSVRRGRRLWPVAWSLRTDPRVVTMERTNIRHLTALPELSRPL